jgi:folate-binding protein YgfZ
MCTLFDLSSRKSIISFSGSDAKIFLQGQTTCDVASVTEENSVFGSMCNHKGRVICLFHLCIKDNIYYMILNEELQSPVIKKLAMFKFRSAVEINDVSNEFSVLGVTDELPTTLIQTLNIVAQVSYALNSSIAMIIVRTKTLQMTQEKQPIKLSSLLNEWDIALTKECFPEITAATSELFIPQMLNLELLGGISFQKGCYTGQEIIARLHYKGSVKKRLVIYRSNVQSTLGEDIYTKDDPNSLGTIISCVADGDSTYTGLIVLKVDAISMGEIIPQENKALLIQRPKYSLD